MTVSNSLEKRTKNDAGFTDDSPQIALKTTDGHFVSTLAISQKFDMYILFSAPGAYAIPVPIKRIAWSWSANVSYNGNGAIPFGIKGSSAKPTTGSGVGTTSRLTWNYNLVPDLTTFVQD
jgi:hypothetical protein